VAGFMLIGELVTANLHGFAFGKSCWSGALTPGQCAHDAPRLLTPSNYSLAPQGSGSAATSARRTAFALSGIPIPPAA
jgi:hypothetical protein